ncbi:folliculin-interacting protein N-terminus-domain-containing protein [Morchella snyderi]|nr:folliculin-interacting protein N-terminus-domain-containing protein [Morchella snyderi]
MLGRLFSTANSTTTSPGGTRPSTAALPDTEELHTRALLYPDLLTPSSSFTSCLSLSNTHSHASSTHAEHPTIDLDAARDVRVIIAQDATASEHKCALYDSKPSSEPPSYSAATDDAGPLSPGVGASQYNRSRRRPPSAQYYSNATCLSSSGGDRSAGGAGMGGGGSVEDEMRVLTDCMFGSAPLAYKGPSTKVHILPDNVEEKKTTRRGSRGPSFSTAYAAQQQQQQQQQDVASTSQQHHTQSQQKEKRKSVLITRLFSVVIPPAPTVAAYTAAVSRDHTPTPASSLGSSHGFPFPKMMTANGGTAPTAPGCAGGAGVKFVKPPKTSMYAVGVIISLPQPPPPPATAQPYSCGSAGSSMHRCCCQSMPFGAFDGGEFCCNTPPSFEEDYQPPSIADRSSGFSDDFLLPPPAGADDRMDLVTRHWDVINRALSDLQRVAQVRILEHLNHYGSVGGTPTASCQNGYKYRKKAELRQGTLMKDEVVCKEVERLRWRIVAGIRTPRVITGQGKWAVWKDEAKWANARFGGRDMNFFFLTLLTAFLGHHTEWLDVLGPAQYRLRHQQQQKATAGGDECGIPTRTVLLAADKMAARRLIYLLSAFLPSKSLPQWGEGLIPPPSRTDSMNYLSQSPPVSSSGAGKKNSIRKKAKKKPSKLSMVTREEDEPIASTVVGWDIPAPHGVELPPAPAQLPLTHPAASTTLKKPLLPTATVIPTNAPASSPQKMLARPGSSSSVASMNLMNTLKRTGTANTSADSSGSFLSFLSFWSNARTGSTAPSETSTQPDEQQPCHHNAAIKICGSGSDDFPRSGLYLDDEDLAHHNHSHHHKHVRHVPPPPPPHAYSLVENEVRISVDESDGIVDVDIPMPHMLDFGAAGTTFTSPISSPSSGGGWPQSLMDTGLVRSNSMSFSSAMLMPSFMPDHDDSGLNVAGWMDDELFHPDFALQAVKPYPDVEEDIKRAMRAEPTPPHGAGAGVTPSSESGDGKWTTVCSVLIADTKKLQIKRLRLRRRRRSAKAATATAAGIQTPLPSALGAHKHLHPAVVAPVAVQEEEEGEEEEVMDEEIVCDVDDVLATAVERVIGAAGYEEEEENVGVQVCKCMVLGALENVVKAVAVGRGSVVGNVLTEGVAKWLSEVEESAAAAAAAV